jgi:uncharacterized protein
MKAPDFSSVIGFQWDSGNIRKNEKHGVRPEEAEEIFVTPGIYILPDARHSNVEPRYNAFGVSKGGRFLHVTFTFRQERTLIRVISARPMHRSEKALYENQATQAHPPLPN